MDLANLLSRLQLTRVAQGLLQLGQASAAVQSR